MYEEIKQILQKNYIQKDTISYLNIDLQLFAKPEEEGRTEEPTEYKKRKSREDGKVAKSQEVISSILLLFTFWAVAIFGPYIFESFEEMIRNYINGFNTIHITMENTNSIVIQLISDIVKPCLPILIAAFVVGFLVNIIQVGFLVTTKPLVPDFKRVAPKFNRVFVSRQTIANLFKSIFKVLIIFGITYYVLEDQMGILRNTINLSPAESFSLGASIAFKLTSSIVIALVFLSIPDYFFQRKEHLDSLKMSPQELKIERKDTEGDPYMKSYLRQRQQEVATKKIAEEVPKADVVITNPTHYAIALKYDQRSMPAPKVVAKGQDYLAERIKQIAKENNVPIYEHKPLAQFLYKNVDIDSIIPPELYEVVASILSRIYNKQNNRNTVFS